MGHLREPSEAAVRDLLAALAPELAAEPLEIRPAIDVRPQWRRTACFVGDAHVLKICWATEAEEPLRRQGPLLTVLAGRDARLPTPIPVAISDDPVALLYRRLPGRILTYEDAGALSPVGRRWLAEQVADALHALHDRAVLDACRTAGIRLAAPRPQATTDELRARLAPRLDAPLQRWLAACLDGVDLALAGAAGPTDAEAVLVHGDFHGHNLVFDETGLLVGVLDLEEVAAGPVEYDLRYLPRQAPTLELLDDVVAAYGPVGGRPVDVDAVFAWHVLTDLGDALWRTETGVEVVAGPIERRTADLRDLLATRGLPR